MENEPQNLSNENSKNFPHDDIYFHSQSHKNLCATQAIVSVLLNCKHEGVTLGPILSELKKDNKTLSQCQTIRDIHNGFAKKSPDAFVGYDSKEDEYHFYITYIPFQGHVYELHCLNKNPIDRGAISQDTEWIHAAIPIVQQRLQELKGNSKRLMAIISDPVKKYERELEKISADSTLPGDERDKKVNHLNMTIQKEKRNKELYRIENLRRRHNWLPFIIELLKAYAAHGSLTSTIKKAIAAKEAENKDEDETD